MTASKGVHIESDKLCRIDRVLISDRIDGVRPGEAYRLGIVPEIAFIRKDGWILGAPRRLARQAYELYAGAWTHFAERPELILRPIAEFDLEKFPRQSDRRSSVVV